MLPYLWRSSRRRRGPESEEGHLTSNEVAHRWAAAAVGDDTLGRLVRELSEAVFRGILHSHHDVYGDLDPAEALAVLDRMRLPEDTEHLAELRGAPEGGRRP
ncbi:hypothetical protein ACGFSI_12815 [Streptomyces virginiae]|uniref:hypothetical protein n=1 Tax=Streptomyces virginiae TaxID=1961 RepID=UPI0037219C04